MLYGFFFLGRIVECPREFILERTVLMYPSDFFLGLLNALGIFFLGRVV